MCELERDVSELDSLRTQLAKANERVAELEQERDHSQRMYNSLLGDLSAGYGELSISECENHLNKFAIENQIKGAFSFAKYLDKSNFSAAIAAKESGFFQLVETFGQQLRKEQE